MESAVMKKSRFTLIILVALLSMACSIQILRTSGKQTSQERPVKDVARVSLEGSGELTILQDGSESLLVETDENLMPYVETEMRNGTLHLRLNSPGSVSILQRQRVRYTLHINSLEGVTIEGSGNVNADSLESDQLALVVDGSGNMQFKSLRAGKLRVEINGSGNVEVQGEASDQTIEVSGSGRVKAGDLRGQSVQVVISGSGNATVWATESLNIDISGSGSARYYGTPQVNISTSGSGNVSRLGDK
jgi:hypothetical protein